MCNLSVVSVRKEPAHKSEMLTQLLFGEMFEILEKNDEWAYIRMVYDKYEGWVDIKQYLPISNETFTKLYNSTQSVTLDIVQILINETKNNIIPVVLGSSLPFIENNFFFIENHKYIFEGNYMSSNENSTGDKLVKNAFLYLDAPYLWGGRSPFGIDCSGFVQMVYKLSNIKLLRDASQQATQGSIVSFLSESLPGDLVFFDNEEGQIVHVGIVINSNQIIHASGRVRIDTIDHEGIFNADIKSYTHKLRLIKRIL